MERVLVTGATGFVGSHLVRHLAGKGYSVRGVSRKEVSPFPEISNYEHAKIEDVYTEKAAGQIYDVADHETPYTKQFMIEMCRQLGKKPRLVPVPKALLRQIGVLTGKAPEIDKLTRSLVISNQKILKKLGWEPKYSMRTGFERTCIWYREKEKFGYDFWKGSGNPCA